MFLRLVTRTRTTSREPSLNSARGAARVVSVPHGTLSAHRPRTSPETRRHPGRSEADAEVGVGVMSLVVFPPSRGGFVQEIAPIRATRENAHDGLQREACAA